MVYVGRGEETLLNFVHNLPQHNFLQVLWCTGQHHIAELDNVVYSKSKTILYCTVTSVIAPSPYSGRMGA